MPVPVYGPAQIEALQKFNEWILHCSELDLDECFVASALITSYIRLSIAAGYSKLEALTQFACFWDMGVEDMQRQTSENTQGSKVQ